MRVTNREHLNADLLDFLQNFKLGRVGELSRHSLTGTFKNPCLIDLLHKTSWFRCIRKSYIQYIFGDLHALGNFLCL